MSDSGSVGDSADDVRSYYEYWWENPRDVRSSVFTRLNQKVFGILRTVSGSRAVDLGSGRGAIARILRGLDFAVTAVDFNPEFARHLRATMPDMDVVCADLREWAPKANYDVATCVEVAQVLSHRDLTGVLERVWPHVGRLVINISNAWSFHGICVRARHFQAPFIVNYTPNDIEKILSETGYRVMRRLGVGIVTPVSLFKEFKVSLVNQRLSDRLASLDDVFPRQCHLYLVEAVPVSDRRDDG